LISVPQKPKGFDDSNLIPLINVVFLMLIFFMVAGQIAAQAPIDINEPQSTSPAHMNPEFIEIYVDSQGQVYSGNSVINLTIFGTSLKESNVRLGVDQSMPAEQLIPLLTELKGYGIISLTLRTRMLVDKQ